MPTLADLLQPLQPPDAPWPTWQRPSSSNDWLAQAGTALAQRQHQERRLLAWGALGLTGVVTVFVAPGLVSAAVGLVLAACGVGGVWRAHRRIGQAERDQQAFHEARLGRTLAAAARSHAGLLPLAQAVQTSGVPVLRGDLAELAHQVA